jgi:S1-C subfamily serine protease
VYVDGELVQSIKDFRDVINSYAPNNQVRLDVQRGAQLETVTITLEKMPNLK